MKLKSFILIIALTCFLTMTITSGYAGTAEPEPSPKAVFEQTIFEFSPVIAGTVVTHRFNVSNKGDTPLNIPGVYTG